MFSDSGANVLLCVVLLLLLSCEKLPDVRRSDVTGEHCYYLFIAFTTEFNRTESFHQPQTQRITVSYR